MPLRVSRVHVCCTQTGKLVSVVERTASEAGRGTCITWLVAQLAGWLDIGRHVLLVFKTAGRRLAS